MKTAALLLAYSLAISASATAATDISSNTTVTHITSSVSNGSDSNAIRPQDANWNWYCEPPAQALYGFWRLTYKQGPYICTVQPLQKEWVMMPSYRDGGVEGVHWKYTDNENDPDCMENWTYHASDGRTVKTRVQGRTTTFGLNRRWCGLPVYNDGGVEGYQWIYCNCRWDWI